MAAVFDPTSFSLTQQVAKMFPSAPKAAPMADTPEVAAWRVAEKARQERVKGQKGSLNAAGMDVVAKLPAGLATGDRKIDNLTATGLAMGVPMDELARNAGIALDYATRPMDEGGGAAPDPGLLDFLLPAAISLAVGKIDGVIAGAAGGGLFSQGNSKLPLVNAGLATVGAGLVQDLAGSVPGFGKVESGAKTLLGGLGNAVNSAAPPVIAGTVIGGSGTQGGGAVSAKSGAGAPGAALTAGFGGDTRTDRSITARNRTGANTLLGG